MVFKTWFTKPLIIMADIKILSAQHPKMIAYWLVRN